MDAYEDDLLGAIQKRLEQPGLYCMGRINQPIGWIEYRAKLIAAIKVNGLLVYWYRRVWENTWVKRAQQLVQNRMLVHGRIFLLALRMASIVRVCHYRS